MPGSLTSAFEMNSVEGAKLRSSFSRASISADTGWDINSEYMSPRSVPPETPGPNPHQVERRRGRRDHRRLDTMALRRRRFLQRALAQQVDEPRQAARQRGDHFDRLLVEGHRGAARDGEAVMNVA